MKVKISRGIATKLICCTALVVLSSAAAFSQAATVSISAASRSGSNTTYTYTLNSGSPALEVGRTILISGMADAGNNGSFAITALGTGTFTVVNTNGMTASEAGTGVEFRLTSGALLSIDGTGASSGISLRLYDSQIHSSPCSADACSGSSVQVVLTNIGGTCLAGDQIPTDAYVLQGGAPTGCDPNDPFEITDNNFGLNAHQASGLKPAAKFSEFKVETHYLSVPVVSISAATNNGDGTTTYSYSRLRGADIAPGENIAVGGFTDPDNNGNFVINLVGTGTFTVTNPNPPPSGGGVTDINQNATGTASGPSAAVCNHDSSICASPDTGFLTVTNNTGSDFTGTISLKGTSPICGAASDSSSTGLVNGASVILALNTESSNCGGFNQAQLLSLTANPPSTAFFGKDDYIFTPLNSASGDTFSILPIPVPAGPIGSATFGPFSCGTSCTYFQPGQFGTESPIDPSPLRFSGGSNFSNLACVPYADFSAPGNPVCVELHEDCTNAGSPCADAGNILYTVQNDYNIDANSLPTGVGGPAFIGKHVVNCPSTAFDTNIFASYKAPLPTFDPLKGSGSGTTSCWVVAFDPSVAAVTTDNSVASFTGFAGLLASPSLNRVNIGSAVPLNFTFPTAGLKLCPTVNNSGGNCPGVSPNPWVAFGTLQLKDCTTFAPTQTEVSAAAGGSNLQNLGPITVGGVATTSYRFNWKITSKTSTTPPPPKPGSCVVMVAQFSSGLTVFPDYFQYK